jgi:hypothetical protein
MKQEAGWTKTPKSKIFHFRNEVEIVAAFSRVAATLPKEIRDSLSFGNGQAETLQVIGADTRRSDVIFHSCSKFYGNEIKKGMLRDTHLYEALIHRRYSLSLKERYGDDFAGMMFVGETISSDLARNDPKNIIKTLSEVFETPIFAVNTREFARILVAKALHDVEQNPSKYSLYTIAQLPLQLLTLTSSSDGYPDWFDQDWCRRCMNKFSGIFKSL